MYATDGLGFDSCCLHEGAGHPLTASHEATGSLITAMAKQLLRIRSFAETSLALADLLNIFNPIEISSQVKGFVAKKIIRHSN